MASRFHVCGRLTAVALSLVWLLLKKRQLRLMLMTSRACVCRLPPKRAASSRAKLKTLFIVDFIRKGIGLSVRGWILPRQTRKMSLCPCLIAVLQRLFSAVIVVTERPHESLYKNSEKKINRYIRNEFCSVAFIAEVSVFAYR